VYRSADSVVDCCGWVCVCVLTGFKSQKERGIYWTLLNFAQQFFDADE